MSVLVWHPVGGVLTRRGRLNPRPGLVYGQYIPEAAAAAGTDGVTAGLLDASLLTDYNSPATTTLTLTDGATFANKTVYGDLRGPSVHNTDIVFSNCRLRGGNHVPTTNDSVINASGTRTGAGKIILVDCEIDPQLPALNRDGIRGNRWRAERTWIHDVIDGVVPYATTGQNSGNAYVDLLGCVIENLRYGYPDYDNGVSGATEHTDGTHNDCVAISGGKQILVKGNLIKCTATNLPGAGTNPSHPNLPASGFGHGQAVLITNTVSNPLDLTVIVEQNWLMGGLHAVFINPNQTAVLRNNRIYRASYVGTSPTYSGYWLRWQQRAGNGVVNDQNVWVDGPYAGQVLTEPRDRGCNFVT